MEIRSAQEWCRVYLSVKVKQAMQKLTQRLWKGFGSDIWCTGQPEENEVADLAQTAFSLRQAERLIGWL